MNVHIVVKSIWDDWVISRLTKYLVDALGWTYGSRPERDADVNVFFPYLDWRHHEWHQGITAGWFTHRRNSAWGKKIWRRTAQAIDLCVSPAKMYTAALSQWGAAVHIPHPVDLQHFSPFGAGAFRSERFTVGVSGIVNPNDPRKGEELVERLMREELYTVVASGRGWPCLTRWYTWEEMPLFYRGLDCYLVTSSIEGGPVTVLEALASGKPVVVPAGVGQCDEYETAYRYRQGDYKDMLGAIEAARIDQAYNEPSVYRQEAEKYPIARWCTDWQNAIANFVEGRRAV